MALIAGVAAGSAAFAGACIGVVYRHYLAKEKSLDHALSEMDAFAETAELGALFDGYKSRVADYVSKVAEFGDVVASFHKILPGDLMPNIVELIIDSHLQVLSKAGDDLLSAEKDAIAVLSTPATPELKIKGEAVAKRIQHYSINEIAKIDGIAALAFEFAALETRSGAQTAAYIESVRARVGRKHAAVEKVVEELKMSLLLLEQFYAPRHWHDRVHGHISLITVRHTAGHFGGRF